MSKMTLREALIGVAGFDSSVTDKGLCWCPEDSGQCLTPSCIHARNALEAPDVEAAALHVLERCLWVQQEVGLTSDEQEAVTALEDTLKCPACGTIGASCKWDKQKQSVDCRWLELRARVLDEVIQVAEEAQKIVLGPQSVATLKAFILGINAMKGQKCRPSYKDELVDCLIGIVLMGGCNCNDGVVCSTCRARKRLPEIYDCSQDDCPEIRALKR